MNSSNSFNICPRCGNSNALNAKYCSRCGGQLKIPEEPVVCHKCHTRNTPLANFCRNCGTTLKIGSETKICPRCGKEVAGDKAICDCGYSFITYQQTIPNTTHAVDVSVLKEEHNSPAQQPEQVKAEKVKKEKKKEKSEKVYSKKGGRGWAIVGILLVLLFAYYIVAPYVLPIGDGVTIRPEFLVNLDKGLVTDNAVSQAVSQYYGYNFIEGIVEIVKDIIGGASIGSVLDTMLIGVMILMVLTVIFCVTAFIHLIVCIVRSFTAKRSKKMNVYFLIIAILSTLAVGLTMLFELVTMPEGFMQTIASWFALGEDVTLGYAIWAIPLYFWFFFLYSLCAKAKKIKEPNVAE